MSKKMLKRKKPINSNYFLDVGPITENQEFFFKEWDKGKNLFSFGAAGTGKTFIALYLALKEVMNEESPYEKCTSLGLLYLHVRLGSCWYS